MFITVEVFLVLFQSEEGFNGLEMFHDFSLF